jgi:membrane fusion protein, multidrug efflux system
MKKVIRNMSKGFLISVLCMVPMIIFGAPEGGANKMPPPKADVYIVPAPIDLSIDLKYPAQVQAYQSVNAYSRVLGVLEEKHFTEGQKVNKGDLLFSIEDDTYKAKVEAAEASLKMNQATYENAKRDWDRIKKLYKKRAVSAERRDSALFAYEEALSGIALAKAELAGAKVDFNYTQVKAPISGIAGLKQVDIGDLVTQNPPMELVRITQNDQVYLDFSMPLSDFQNIQNGMWSMPEDGKVQVNIISNGKKLDKQGVIDFIDVNIDKSTSTVKMRALVDNSDHSLLAGSFIRVSLEGIVQKDVITIPQKALLQNPLGTIVFIEDKGVAAVRPVIVGKESGDKYVVAGGPLKSGDKVVVNNFFRVKPGKPFVIDKIINK